jgi:hypothetical protein
MTLTAAGGQLHFARFVGVNLNHILSPVSDSSENSSGSFTDWIPARRPMTTGSDTSFSLEL